MNVFIVPSWYPSQAFPTTGIFFKDQAIELSKAYEQWKIGLSLWGSHEPSLWLQARRPLEALIKYASRPPLPSFEQLIETNLVEFFHPAYTWSRHISNGNIHAITNANQLNLDRYTEYFGKPDLILAQVSFPGGFIAQHLSKTNKIPYAIEEHMSPFPMPALKGGLQKLVLEPLRKADKVLVVSEHLKSKVETYGIPAVLVSNFIDDDFFTVPTSKKEVSMLKIVAVGRLATQKGFSSLIDELKRLKEKTSFSLTIAGDGVLRGVLEKQIRRLGLEDEIHLVGNLDKTELRSLLWESDVFVSSSLHENQPVSILEALACGLPVISTNWTGADKLINVENGILCADSADLVENLAAFRHEHFNAAEIRSDYDARFGKAKSIGRLANILAQAADLD